MRHTPLSRRDVRLVLGGDLRHFLRDPLTLLLTMVMPVVLLPAMMWLSGSAHRSQSEELADKVLPISAPSEFADWLLPADRLEIRDGRLPREPLPGALPYDTATGMVQAEVTLPTATTPARVVWRSSSRLGKEARDRVVAVLERHQATARRALWSQLGLDVAPEQVLSVEVVDVATATARGGLQAGRFIPALLVFLVMSGGMYTALDLFAGEKERGTLETLLVSRVDRRAVLVAKFLLVMGFSSITGLLAVGSLWGSLQFGLIAEPGDGTPLRVSPASVGLTLAVLLPLTAELSSLMILAAAWSPDFRTGQTLSLPLLLFAVAPAGVAAIPGTTLSVPLALLPVTGLSLAVRDALAGQLGLAMAAVVVAATLAHAGVALWAAARLLGREAVLVGSGASHRRRHQERYGPEAVGVYAVSMMLLWYLGQLAQARDMAWGMVLSQVLFVGGVAVGGVAWLGLPMRRTMQLRLPRVADLALALVAGLCTPGMANFVLRVQEPLIPTSNTFLEQFEAALTVDAPLWVAFLVFALLPGICEELLFRGTLLGLLRRSLPPVGRSIVVGALFGLMHLDLVRILPTATLGVLLAAAALRSRSLLVPVLIHVVHNGLVLAGADGPWLALVHLPAWAEAGLAGIAVVAVAAMGRGGPPRA